MSNLNGKFHPRNTFTLLSLVHTDGCFSGFLSSIKLCLRKRTLWFTCKRILLWFTAVRMLTSSPKGTKSGSDSKKTNKLFGEQGILSRKKHFLIWLCHKPVFFVTLLLWNPILLCYSVLLSLWRILENKDKKSDLWTSCGGGDGGGQNKKRKIAYFLSLTGLYSLDNCMRDCFICAFYLVQHLKLGTEEWILFF